MAASGESAISTSSEWKIAVVSDFPVKKAIIPVNSELSLSGLTALAATALSIPAETLAKYALRGVGPGFDVVTASESKAEVQTLRTVGFADGWSALFFAPADLKPLRKRRAKEVPAAQLSDEARFAGLTAVNVLSKLKNTKGKARANVLAYIERYWNDIIKSSKSQLLSLPKTHWVDILNLDALDAKEPELFTTALAWAKEEIKRTPGAKEDPATLRTVMADLLPLIRFPIMTATEMALAVTPTKVLTAEQELQLYTYIGSQAGKKKTFDDDKKKPAPKVGGFIAKSRRPPGLYLGATSRFEDNTGIIYWIGTGEGKSSSYTNPAGSAVIITMSSSGGSASSCIFDRNIGGSAAENSYGREREPWIQVEFKRHKVRLDRYFIAQDQDHYLRSWRMEGSDDGSTWTTLREHSSDSTITSGSRWAFFDLKSPSFYRFIRLQLTGPGHNSATNFDITEMEFFGYVANLDAQN